MMRLFRHGKRRDMIHTDSVHVKERGTRNKANTKATAYDFETHFEHSRHPSRATPHGSLVRDMRVTEGSAANAHCIRVQKFRL